MNPDLQPQITQMNTDDLAVEKHLRSSESSVGMNPTRSPLVSIGVPAYNAGKTIGAMIKTVLAQSYGNWELLIVDDGSKDDTVAVAKSFEDSRIKVFSDGENRKIAARLNQLVDMAQGRFFARMDADDEMLPDRIERQVGYLLAHPEVDVLGGGAIIIDEAGEVYGARNVVEAPTEVSSFIHPTVVGKTEWFRDNRYDGRFSGCEDTELWRRARRHSVFRLLNGPVIRYRDSRTLDLKKYFFAQRQNLRVVFLGKGISFFERMKLFVGSILRTVLAFLAVLAGREKAFVARRNSSCSAISEQENA